MDICSYRKSIVAAYGKRAQDAVGYPTSRNGIAITLVPPVGHDTDARHAAASGGRRAINRKLWGITPSRQKSLATAATGREPIIHRSFGGTIQSIGVLTWSRQYDRPASWWSTRCPWCVTAGSIASRSKQRAGPDGRASQPAALAVNARPFCHTTRCDVFAGRSAGPG